MFVLNMFEGQQCTDRTVEALVRTALYLDSPYIQDTEGWGEDTRDGLDLSSRLARAKIATDLQKRGKGFLLKVLIEDWDHKKLIKELY